MTRRHDGDQHWWCEGRGVRIAVRIPVRIEAGTNDTTRRPAPAVRARG